MEVVGLGNKGKSFKGFLILLSIFHFVGVGRKFQMMMVLGWNRIENLFGTFIVVGKSMFFTVVASIFNGNCFEFKYEWILV